MKAYLVYQREEAEKNKRFLELFREAGKEFGIDFSYVSREDYRQKDLPDFVLNRTRDAKVSRWYEQEQVPVFHSSGITEIGNHKGKTLEFLRKRLPREVLQRKWAPETIFLPKERLVEWQTAIALGNLDALYELDQFWKQQMPFVIKSVDGHGGSEVMAIWPPEKAERFDGFAEYCNQIYGKLDIIVGKDCILQEMIPSDSRDVRVYILGNQIYLGMMRQGQGDFRSNASLGGHTEVYPLSDRERMFVELFLQAFQGEVLGLAGLDFILTRDGRLVFNELEEMVGCRMLYQKTDRNIVRDYVFWLYELLT